MFDRASRDAVRFKDCFFFSGGGWYRSGGGAPKLTMRGRFHHRKGCGGRESGVQLEIQESNTGQRELSNAKFGSHL